jgi:Flp pilus assembly protein TadB
MDDQRTDREFGAGMKMPMRELLLYCAGILCWVGWGLMMDNWLGLYWLLAIIVVNQVIGWFVLRHRRKHNKET